MHEELRNRIYIGHSIRHNIRNTPPIDLTGDSQFTDRSIHKRILWSLFLHLISLLEMYIIVRLQFVLAIFLPDHVPSVVPFDHNSWDLRSADTSFGSSHTHLNCLRYTGTLQTALYLHLRAPRASPFR